MRHRGIRVGFVSLAVGALLGTAPAFAAQAARTTVRVQVHDTVDAKTTIARLGQTVTFPTGTFAGTIDASNGAVVGDLTLPAATTTVRLKGLGLATATLSIVPVHPTFGRYDFGSEELAATSVFLVHVDSVRPLSLPVNLVGSRCVTARTVTLRFKGQVGSVAGGTVKGTYTLPSLAHCGAFTQALSLLLSGPGNSFRADLSPI